MSFTTLEAVNFVFVRLETADGLAAGERRHARRPDLERGVVRIHRRQPSSAYIRAVAS